MCVFKHMRDAFKVDGLRMRVKQAGTCFTSPYRLIPHSAVTTVSPAFHPNDEFRNCSLISRSQIILFTMLCYTVYDHNLKQLKQSKYESMYPTIRRSLSCEEIKVDGQSGSFLLAFWINLNMQDQVNLEEEFKMKRFQQLYKLRVEQDSYWNTLLTSCKYSQEQLGFEFNQAEAALITSDTVNSACQLKCGRRIATTEISCKLLVISKDWTVVHIVDSHPTSTVAQSCLFPGFDLDSFPFMLSWDSNNYFLVNVMTQHRDLLIYGSANNSKLQNAQYWIEYETDRFSLSFCASPIDFETRMVIQNWLLMPFNVDFAQIIRAIGRLPLTAEDGGVIALKALEEKNAKLEDDSELQKKEINQLRTAFKKQFVTVQDVKAEFKKLEEKNRKTDESRVYLLHTIEKLKAASKKHQLVSSGTDQSMAEQRQIDSQQIRQPQIAETQPDSNANEHQVNFLLDMLKHKEEATAKQQDTIAKQQDTIAKQQDMIEKLFQAKQAQTENVRDFSSDPDQALVAAELRLSHQVLTQDDKNKQKDEELKAIIGLKDDEKSKKDEQHGEEIAKHKAYISSLEVNLMRVTKTMKKSTVLIENIQEKYEQKHLQK